MKVACKKLCCVKKKIPTQEGTNAHQQDVKHLCNMEWSKRAVAKLITAVVLADCCWSLPSSLPADHGIGRGMRVEKNFEFRRLTNACTAHSKRLIMTYFHSPSSCLKLRGSGDAEIVEEVVGEQDCKRGMELGDLHAENHSEIHTKKDLQENDTNETTNGAPQLLDETATLVAACVLESDESGQHSMPMRTCKALPREMDVMEDDSGAKVSSLPRTAVESPFADVPLTFKAEWSSEKDRIAQDRSRRILRCILWWYLLSMLGVIRFALTVIVMLAVPRMMQAAMRNPAYWISIVFSARARFARTLLYRLAALVRYACRFFVARRVLHYALAALIGERLISHKAYI